MVTDNPELGRFELVEEGKPAFADYRLEGNALVLSHVAVDPALRGHGTAGRLMAGVMEIIRERELKVVPLCGYAVTYIARHPEYHDLLDHQSS